VHEVPLYIFAMMFRWPVDRLGAFLNNVKVNGGHTEHLHHNS